MASPFVRWSRRVGAGLALTMLSPATIGCGEGDDKASTVSPSAAAVVESGPTPPVVETSLPRAMTDEPAGGVSAPWYTLDEPGFESGPAVDASRAATTDQAISMSAVWSQVDADSARLLVVRTNVLGPAVPPLDAVNSFEVDTGRGEWWTFESFGMRVE